jgi:hypothetical protein
MFVQCSSRATPRQQVIDWLKRHADVAVRLLVAPPGFGKSTALSTYASTPSPCRRLYVTLDARGTWKSLTASIAAGLGAGASAGGDAAALLAAAAPLEIIIDDGHLAAGDLLAKLNELIADLPPNVFFIVASQRRDIFDVGTLFARGLIAVCDHALLALDAGDARALFAADQIDVSAAAIELLVARCAGWPPAIAGTIGEMRHQRQPLDAAYERWRCNWSVPAIDLVTTLLARVPAAQRAAARRHFAQGEPLDQDTLAVLHRCGFFVRFEAGTFEIMPWVEDLYPATQSLAAELPLLAIELFGRFTAKVAGVPIVWARRRDQHIIKYLLLRPQGSVTRTELADVFWPEMPRPLAMQNLRTACSTIRRAIGNVVGMRHVDNYLIAGQRLILNRAAISCDVDRFRRHVALAQADDAAGLFSAAIAHLRSAEQLYGRGLFEGDISEPLFFDATQELAAVYAGVLARLNAALIERGSPILGQTYAAKALKFGVFGRPEPVQRLDLRRAAS